MSTHPISYYERSKQEWNNEERIQITTEYVNNEMNIIEIGNIHKRTPGCISYQLHKIGVLSNRLDARGYNEYKLSPLYQDIVSTTKQRKEMQKDNNIPVTIVAPKLRKSDKIILELQEIKELLKEIITRL